MRLESGLVILMIELICPGDHGESCSGLLNSILPAIGASSEVRKATIYYALDTLPVTSQIGTRLAKNILRASQYFYNRSLQGYGVFQPTIHLNISQLRTKPIPV